VVTGKAGVVNRAANPPYRLFISDMNLAIENFSNQFSEGPATMQLTGKFMGSGQTLVTATFRPENNGPDFDMNIRVENADLRALNDLLRTYAKFDVKAGLFSVYSEIRVKNQHVQGYVKPLFTGMDVYDPAQDADKSTFRKLYEKAVGGIAKILENRTPREDVATKATIEGPIGGAQTNVVEVIIRLIQNAFFKAILPGLEAEVGRPRRS
jgi:hypothetical protein